MYTRQWQNRGAFSKLNHILIDLHVFLTHDTSGEIALYMHARYITINLINALNKAYHFCDIMYQEASFTMNNNFRGGSTRKRNDRTAERHSFNHHHTKGLLPLNRVEESAGTTEQTDFLFHIYRANVSDLLIINLRLNDLMKVVY